MPDQSKKQVRFQDLMDSIDRLSTPAQEFEIDEVSISSLDNYSEAINDVTYTKEGTYSHNNKLEIKVRHSPIKNKGVEKITIPKHELIMVLKENESVRKLNQKYKANILEMREKMWVVKELIDQSEAQKEDLEAQTKKLKVECQELRKLLNKRDIACDKKSEKLIEQLKDDFKKAQQEIENLKRTIGRFSSQNVDQ